MSKVFRKSNVILCGDYNVKFGTNAVDEISLLDLMASYGFIPTVTKPTRGQNCLDNIFINFQNNYNYQVDIVELGLSDHLSQIIKIDFDNYFEEEETIVNRPVTLRGKNDFFNFVSEYDWKFINVPGMGIDEKFQKFHELLHDAFCKAFPIKSKKVKKNVVQTNQTSWFCQELQEMRSIYQTITRFSKENPTPNIISYKKQYRNKYRKAIKDARVLGNDRVIKMHSRPAKAMWDIVGSHKKNKKKKVEHHFTAEEYNNYFSNIANEIRSKIVPPNNVDPLDFVNPSLPYEVCFNLREVGFNEVRNVLKSIKSTKTQDIYGFTSEILLSILNLIVIPLTQLINLSFKENVFPSCFKMAKVVPIPKKGNLNELTNHRPVSVLPILSKVVEKIIKTQIYNFFERNNLFNECQFGFRSGRSTSGAVLKLMDTIVDAFENKKYACTLL